MITVTYEKKENEVKITIKGHAGYNPGNDIVCAACSALFFTLMEEMNLTRREMALRIMEGDSFIQVLEPDETAIRVIMNGYKMIADTYPEHVTVCGW